MGLFDTFVFAFKTARERSRLRGLELVYLEEIQKTQCASISKVNKDILNLVLHMSNVAWEDTPASICYSKNNISIELYRQAYVMATLSRNNKFIKSKNSLLSNVVMVYEPEKNWTLLSEIFQRVKSGKDSSADKELVDLLLQVALLKY